MKRNEVEKVADEALAMNFIKTWLKRLGVAAAVVLALLALFAWKHASAQSESTKVFESAVVPISSCWVLTHVEGINEESKKLLVGQCKKEKARFWQNLTRKSPIVVFKRVRLPHPKGIDEP